MKDKKLIIAKYVFEIILITFLSFIYYLIQPVKTPKVLYIPQGSINQIITQLADKNYDVCKLDSLILRFIGKPQSGWINLGSTTNTRADFLIKLTTAKAALRDVTLIPGETTYVFLNQLAQNLGLDRKKLQEEFEKQSPVKEGVFVPNTYKIPVGISEKALISLLLKISLKKMEQLSIKIFGAYNEKKWFHYVTIASIIQKESANNKEMPLVSSVIYNRLRKGMKLQMDGSLNYGKYSHIKITADRIKHDNSLYNTYLHKGIPSVPVCNVSIDAIKAAIFPANTDYLYFMKSKNGTHDFTCNYSTHLRNIKRATK
ncbi:endolytic transglycosylase MltG [Sulfurimonas paralvinellae]|uniref:Endolytic murein transglycosylase n=1 Tax=Sulfurimonas paralvinellae TaxID=317658 RepID=A0A7M1B7N9_9BACT|nr:endolytic transglycosylase MltG [Sulfurimonas paralvinellae]QOP45710.1 endolytic transglycosylase MltG [Sulfurimonas paralvinellae]